MWEFACDLKDPPLLLTSDCSLRRVQANTNQGSNRLGRTVMGAAEALSNYSCSQATDWIHSSTSQQPAEDVL